MCVSKIRLLIWSAVLVLAGCAHAPPDSTSVRICDESGCSLRPKHLVAMETVDTGEIANESMVALETAAKAEPRAAYDLGLRYFRGDGVRQDSYQALVWMRAAAEGGHLAAQKALGAFYLAGLEEMGADPQEAAKWLAIAVSRGDEASRPLLVQAAAAKKSEQAYYRWKTEWRDVYLRLWTSGYPYHGRWRMRAWSWR